MKQAFTNLFSCQPKNTECIRADGAGDENPSRDKVQFLWTLRHIKKICLAILVTTRLWLKLSKQRWNCKMVAVS